MVHRVAKLPHVPRPATGSQRRVRFLVEAEVASMFLSKARQEQVRQQVAALAPGGGWLLGSSNSIPDFVPEENYRALLAAGLTYGQYR